MTRDITLTLCLAFILYLLLMDAKRKPNVSLSLWVPWLWFTILASRPLSTWFGMGIVTDSSDYYLEGSPFDRNIFLTLIGVGTITILKRKGELSAIIRNNKFIFLYILYLGLSTLWSDYTFVSFKRWIKEIGNLIMVLIVITEPDYILAIKTMIKRCAYVLIPLSLIFNRYFPEISRSYSIGGGDPQFTGITTHKNSLGALSLICGLVFCWNLLAMWRNTTDEVERREIFLHLIFLLLIVWLLSMAHSATALLGTIIGFCMLFGLGLPSIKNNTNVVKYYILILIIILLGCYFSFDIMSLTASSLGRSTTLTGRTDLWKMLIGTDINPLVGTGYESFWLGDRIAKLWEIYWWHPNQAHNGYLEIYLNLGIIGLTLLFGIVYSAYKNINQNLSLLREYDYQIFRLTFIVVILLVNITEAYFKGFMWFFSLLVLVEPCAVSDIGKNDSAMITDNDSICSRS